MSEKKKNKSENEPISNGMDKIVSLCKRRGFVFPGSEIYGGLSNSYDYGPLGVELKNNIKQLWWNRFVHRRDDMVGLDSALIMNPKVWEASGHTKNFIDALSECKNCNNRIRVDQYLSAEQNSKFNAEIQKVLQKAIKESRSPKGDQQIQEIQQRAGEVLNKTVNCPHCKKRNWSEARPFNLMLSTHLGATMDERSFAYFRPEIAQAMFVNFKQVLDTTRRKLPFGIASQGKAFRNEITPGNFIFRTREFDLMELEYFVRENEWGKWFEYLPKKIKKKARKSRFLTANERIIPRERLISNTNIRLAKRSCTAWLTVPISI